MPADLASGCVFNFGLAIPETHSQVGQCNNCLRLEIYQSVLALSLLLSRFFIFVGFHSFFLPPRFVPFALLSHLGGENSETIYRPQPKAGPVTIRCLIGAGLAFGEDGTRSGTVLFSVFLEREQDEWDNG